MARKRIALLLGQAEENTQSLFIKGFIGKAMELDYDVCIFSMFIKYQNSPEREIGDASIFKLINYDRFDAVVVMADTIQTPGVISDIEETIKDKFNGPVLFVDKESKYFPTVTVDNYSSVNRLVSHLIEKHGITDIGFLSGKSWHPHAKIRVQAYKDALVEHGIEVDDNKIYFGDFWYTSGQSLAERMTEGDLRMPRALACANDCMALGAAKVFSSRHVKIPDDIAIIGYDTNDEGQHSPIPLTSAPIPSAKFGAYAAESIADLLNGRGLKEFKCSPELFIGGTCGCGCDSIKPEYPLRDKWETDLLQRHVFSLFNYMDEDLMAQTTFSGVVGTVFSSVEKIRGFNSLSICLNEGWVQRGSLDRKDHPFADKMIEIFRCGAEGENKDRVSPDYLFEREDMLPGLYDERDKPCAFFFMPLYFSDKVFGYSAISYGDRAVSILPDYRAWLKSVARGLEYFRRNDELIRSSQILETGIVRDNLTGLYNYQGLQKQSGTIMNIMRNNGCEIGVLAVDIKELSAINREYGRDNGDKAIITLSSILVNIFSSYDICAALGNGELIVVRIISGGEDEMHICTNKLKEKLSDYNNSGVVGFDIDIYYGIECGAPSTPEELERLINTAISRKNAYKINAQKIRNNEELTEEEQKEANIVQSILDDNRINYHFQPIVRAKDGGIYAYEALMRANVTPYIAPPVVLRYAEFLNRLYDVEKATFNNVLRIVREQKSVFDGTRKVFINSIPGCQLKEGDKTSIRDTVKDMPGAVVVELTEQFEMTDEMLNGMKKEFSEIGVETAVDDYGTGYSNVTNLLRYMPDYVKIDRMLLSNIEDSPQKQHFVKDIVQFSHDNNIMALAEGVETSEELNTVIALGVDLIQGYYTARPSATIVDSIDPGIISEIIDANYLAEDPSRKIFYAGKDGRINLAVLNEEKITRIVFHESRAIYKDIEIVGARGIDTSIDIVIKDGYEGVLTFENVDLGDRNEEKPAISVEGKSNVSLIFKGKNILRGGIDTSEDSVVNIEGL